MKITSFLKFSAALPIAAMLALAGCQTTPAAMKQTAPATAKPPASKAEASPPASFEWPTFQVGLKPGPSASSSKAKSPTLALIPAAADTPDDQASYGGLWEGWMCAKKVRDVKVAISNVTSEGARVEYRTADDNYPAFSVTLPMKFKGDVLRGTPNNSAYLTFGIRSDGHMNVKYRVPNRWWCSGILKRTKAPPDA